VNDDDLDRLDRVTSQLHAIGREATDDHNHAAGVAYRYAANLVRREFGLDLFDYAGREDETATIAPYRDEVEP
jgi:hypothetical protein